MLMNLLIYRLTLFNALVLCLSIFLEVQRGLVSPLFLEDSSMLSYVMIVLTAGALLFVFIRSLKVSRMWNHIKQNNTFPIHDLDPVKFITKSRFVGEAGKAVVMMGLLGTVIGLSISLQALQGNALNDVSGAELAVTQLMLGMRTAINTTILAGFLWLILLVNRVMLHTATICMLRDFANLLKDRGDA